MQKINENLPLKINAIAEFWDAKKYPTYESIREAKRRDEKPDAMLFGKNKWVTAGKDLFNDALIGTAQINLNYIGVGSGTTPPADGDTDLETPITRKVCTDRFKSGGKAYHTAFFASSEGNGLWNESALFVQEVAGVMWARLLFGASFTKDNSKTATITYINTPTETT